METKMALLRNQKGVVLITAYLVIIILLGLSGAFFSRAIQEKRLVQRHENALKALYNAEKGIAYAYFESRDKGWMWFTHNWNANRTTLVSANLTATDALRTQSANADCYFINAGADEGCYAANDGSFILKTFPDPTISEITVVRSKGIYGDIERVVEYRISRKAIFDFAWWTPYDLYLNNVGDNVNGGRIHANGNIYMYNSKRLYGVDTISTGKDKTICYKWSTYYGPGRYDYYMDGSNNINGTVPLPHLDTPRRWAGTSEEQDYQTQYPWKYQSANGNWYWRWYGYEYAGQWPPRDWRNEEYFFYGDSQERNNRTVLGKELNYYNTWIYPVKKDEQGNIIFDEDGNVLFESVEQIPAELDATVYGDIAYWDWEKYGSQFDDTFAGQPQQQLKFTVYDPDNPENVKYVEQTRWKIEDGKIVMTDLSDPQGVTYWAMLQNYDYWKTIGYSDADAETWSTHINPEILDGTYGSEFSTGQKTMKVDNTNSIKQPEAWNTFLADSNLETVLFANDRGEDMEPPRFATTYKEKSKQAGLYLSKSADEQGNAEYSLRYADGTTVTYTANTCGAYSDYSNPDDYWACVEDSIDVLVERINRKADGKPLPKSQRAAHKVKFINTYTNKTNTILELDLKKMNKAGTFPANGIIYSEVPIRLTHAKQLPYTGNPKKATFNLICEENIYLKGNYNNPHSDTQWMPSAIISKKLIYELSDSFNDPGWKGYDDGFTDTLSSNPAAVPAFRVYPNYPYVYVKVDANGNPILDASKNFIEADPAGGAGAWVYQYNFPSGSDEYYAARRLRDEIQTAWWATFDQKDPTGMQTYTVASGHPNIDGQTWGAMPNRVKKDTTYNCLMASYWNKLSDSGGIYRGIPTGALLERWIDEAQYGTTGTSSMYRIMNGAYFQLDEDGFTAFSGVDLLDISRDIRPVSRPYGGPYWGPYYRAWGGNNRRSYDQRFRDPRLSQNTPIFFGGGESSWREITVSAF
jgi:hypothetical protein